MSDEDWEAGYAKSLGMVLNGGEIPWPGRRGEQVTDDSFLVVFNAHYEDLDWTAPGEPWGAAWELVLDTALPELGTDEYDHDGPGELKAGDTFEATARSVQMLRRTR